ncbi:thioredoxin family protein [soil metagenome]
MASSSTMLPLGTAAPDFVLPEVTTGETVTVADLPGDALLVMFLCRHCPFVVHVQHELAAIGRDYADRPLAIVAISANDAEAYPDDAPEGLAAQKAEVGFDFPYLHDASQETARAYAAACTPDFFLFDADHQLAYRGQLDDSRPGSDTPVTGVDLRRAIDLVLDGRPVPEPHHPSMGCGIKWRP